MDITLIVSYQYNNNNVTIKRIRSLRKKGVFSDVDLVCERYPTGGPVPLSKRITREDVTIKILP